MVLFKELRLPHFGKFESKVFKFQNGLNLILGKNEAGKSTLFHAILGTLFGFKTDRDRYLPWANASAYHAGLTLETSDTVISIDRNFLDDMITYAHRHPIKSDPSPTVYQGKVSPLGRSSEREVYLNKIQDLFGFSDAEIFKNSLFIEQRSLHVLPSQQTASELKHLISNISEFKYDEVIAHLEEKYFELTKKNPNGIDKRNDRLLEDVRKQVEDLDQRIKRAHSNQESLQKLAQKISEHKANLKTKEDRYKLITKSLASLEQLSRLVRKETELKESLSELQKRKSLVERLMGELQVLEKSKPQLDRLFFGGLIALFLVLLIFSLTTTIHWIWIGMGLGITSAALGYYFLLQKKYLETYELQQTRIKSQLEVLPKLDQLIPSVEIKQKALFEVESQKKEFESCLVDPQKAIPHALKDQALEKSTLEDQIERLRETYLFEKQNYVFLAKGLESPFTLEEDLFDLKLKEKNLKTKANALWMAKELLTQMVVEFRKEHLHYFAQDSEHLFQDIVSSSYQGFTIDENYLSPSIEVHHKSISVQALSCGTQDQLYFAMKLSLLKALSSGRKLPLFLDDPFVNFDHNRRLKALNLLERYSKEHQIFLFTYDPWYSQKLPDIHCIDLDAL